MVQTNVLGVMHGVQLAFKYMDKGCTVVNIASLGGLTPTPVTPAYGATKAAVVAYTRLHLWPFKGQMPSVKKFCNTFY